MSSFSSSAPGSKARFRVSLLLLGGLLIAKLVWKPSSSTQLAAGSQSLSSAGETTTGFRPVGDENAQVWGLAGSLLNLFSGRPPSPDERRQEEEQKATDERANQLRWGKEYDERREQERAEKEQDMHEYEQRKRAEQEQYDRQRQAEQEQERQRQQEYYDNRQREQGF